MKSTRHLVLGLAAAGAVLLASCGDNEQSASNADTGVGPPEGADAYPLTTCVVSGEELGSMGKPYVIEHDGTEVRFCCKECLPKFEEDPDKYLAKLKAGGGERSESSAPDQ